ncbi:sensor histidine kinase [Flavobacterium selenitireducens]|uniref:sensor histidine kinase n=1 Tax=Flavobacterium selenitireducens TaxID=2722704 RepID=UPI00168AC2CC|nr:HAMP domain-containing sensor histidine kinase [Flavobacterium selenitireducens]MBD3582372.1 HAMP domain-containing histidine kinase [Flavobacterium selenitireducens]
MARKIQLAVALMSVCVCGILSLQLAFAYSSFQAERNLLEKQVNEAFASAFEAVRNDRDEAILDDLRQLVSDPTFIEITSRVNPVYGTTVFTMKELQPPFKGQTQLSLSIETFPEKVEPITPKARQAFIDHIVKNARNDLKNGYVFYYTQKLGDSLSKAKYEVPIDTAMIGERFRNGLGKAGLPTRFRFAAVAPNDGFKTKPIDLSLKTNAAPKLLYAVFPDPDAVVFERIKWILAGSFVLMSVAVVCFGYTLKVMLSQQKLSAVKDDFIHNMTHELHTPLASLTVTAESLRKFQHDATARETYLDIILLQAQRLGALTAEILETARAGKVGNREKQTIVVSDLLKKAMAAFPCDAVAVEDNVGDLEISGDANSLFRMLTNLIDNGLKYNPGPGAPLLVKADVSGKKLLLEVSDNGPGIPEAEKTQIFDAFYRIGTGNRHDVKGYGLGLYFVKEVVRKHNGKISVHDNENKGTTFRIAIAL